VKEKLKLIIVIIIKEKCTPYKNEDKDRPKK